MHVCIIYAYVATKICVFYRRVFVIIILVVISIIYLVCCSCIYCVMLFPHYFTGELTEKGRNIRLKKLQLRREFLEGQ